MTVALLTLNILSLIGLSVVVFYGVIIPQGHGALGQHLLLALITVMLAIFTHVMTYFYFVGMGSTLRRTVEETGRGQEALRESRRIKKKVFPWAWGTVGMLMATFILGGGAHTRALPGWIHGGLGYMVLALSFAAFFEEARYLIEQNRVINELERALVGKENEFREGLPG